MGLAKNVAPSFQNLPDRLSRPAALLSYKSLKSFNAVSSDTKLNLNLELGNFRNSCSIVKLKVNQISEKGDAKQQLNHQLVGKTSFENVSIFLSSKLVTLSFVLR